MKRLLLLIGMLAAINAFLFTRLQSHRPETPVVPAEPTELRLEWNAAPDPRVLEYRIYVATEDGSYDFEQPTAVVPAGVAEWPVGGLPPGRYFAVVTAATATEESSPTEPIEFHVP